MLTAGDAQISRVKVPVSETIAVVEVARRQAPELLNNDTLPQYDESPE